MKNKTQITTLGFILRSKINPDLVFCTDGQFHTDCFVGPGSSFGAKSYKTESNAKRAAARYNATVEKELSYNPYSH